MTRARTRTSVAEDPAPRRGAKPSAAPPATWSAATEPIREVEPYSPGLPDRARQQWLAADWRGLATIAPEALERHPDRGVLAAYGAAARCQLGDSAAGRALAQRALEWGCSPAILGQVLLNSAQHTLARASLFARRDPQARGHFAAAVATARLSSEKRRHAQGRHDRAEADLRDRLDAARLLLRGGSGLAAAQAPAWLAALVQRCLDAADPHERIDQALAATLTAAVDRARFLMMLADAFLARQDRMTALHFLRQAVPLAAELEAGPRGELARRLIVAGSPESALDLVVDHALAAGLADSPDPGATQPAQAVSQAYRRMRALALADQEHGHDLLLAHLERRLADLQQRAEGRRLTLIEIGTTREDVPGQGSTAKLAEFCKRRGLHFVTVDMDPHNTNMARQGFARLDVAFEAITMKGEDYLRGLPGPLDFVFLDAYDFDHGMHSDLRQSRYEKYLGSRIDEQACHRMHLDCAQSVAAKLWAHGAVCVDDTWLHEERWTAKGTLAVPFLLEAGFEVLEARNRAALLARAGGGGARRDA